MEIADESKIGLTKTGGLPDRSYKEPGKKRSGGLWPVVSERNVSNLTEINSLRNIYRGRATAANAKRRAKIILTIICAAGILMKFNAVTEKMLQCKCPYSSAPIATRDERQCEDI